MCFTICVPAEAPRHFCNDSQGGHWSSGKMHVKMPVSCLGEPGLGPTSHSGFLLMQTLAGSGGMLRWLASRWLGGRPEEVKLLAPSFDTAGSGGVWRSDPGNGNAPSPYFPSPPPNKEIDK